MFDPRNINDIQIGFFKYLAESGSALTDIAPGSVLHSLTRSFAGIHSEQDLILNEMADSMFYAKAKGDDLDAIASNFFLTRRSGEVSKGFVLALSNDPNVTIAPNTVLIDIVSGLQYYINSSFPVSILSFIEAKLPIIATQQGVQYNLKAGSKLISPLYPTVNFIVGSHRTNNGEVCGDLRAGSSKESDNSFRQRIIDVITNRRGTTKTAIRAALLEKDIIEEVFFKNDTPGFLEVFIDSPNSLSQLNFVEFNKIIDDNKAAGIVFSSSQTVRLQTDIQIYVLPLPGIDKDALSDEIVALSLKYLYSLNVGQIFKREELKSEILKTEKIVQVEIITPAVNIQPTSNSVVRTNNIWVTYDVV